MRLRPSSMQMLRGCLELPLAIAVPVLSLAAKLLLCGPAHMQGKSPHRLMRRLLRPGTALPLGLILGGLAAIVQSALILPPGESESDAFESPSPTVGLRVQGLWFIFAAQLIASLQQVIEDSFLPPFVASLGPLELVGIEGMWGFALGVGVLLPLAQYGARLDAATRWALFPSEDTCESFRLLAARPGRVLVLGAFILTIPAFFLAGEVLAGLGDAFQSPHFHSTLDALRSLTIFVLGAAFAHWPPLRKLWRGERLTQGAAALQLIGFTVAYLGATLFREGQERVAREHGAWGPENAYYGGPDSRHGGTSTAGHAAAHGTTLGSIGGGGGGHAGARSWIFNQASAEDLDVGPAAFMSNWPSPPPPGAGTAMMRFGAAAVHVGEIDPEHPEITPAPTPVVASPASARSQRPGSSPLVGPSRLASPLRDLDRSITASVEPLEPIGKGQQAAGAAAAPATRPSPGPFHSIHMHMGTGPAFSASSASGAAWAESEVDRAREASGGPRLRGGLPHTSIVRRSGSSTLRGGPLASIRHPLLSTTAFTDDSIEGRECGPLELAPTISDMGGARSKGLDQMSKTPLLRRFGLLPAVGPGPGAASSFASRWGIFRPGEPAPITAVHVESGPDSEAQAPGPRAQQGPAQLATGSAHATPARPSRVPPKSPGIRADIAGPSIVFSRPDSAHLLTRHGSTGGHSNETSPLILDFDAGASGSFEPRDAGLGSGLGLHPWPTSVHPWQTVPAAMEPAAVPSSFKFAMGRVASLQRTTTADAIGLHVGMGRAAPGPGIEASDYAARVRRTSSTLARSESLPIPGSQAPSMEHHVPFLGAFRGAGAFRPLPSAAPVIRVEHPTPSMTSAASPASVVSSEHAPSVASAGEQTASKGPGPGPGAGRSARGSLSVAIDLQRSARGEVSNPVTPERKKPSSGEDPETPFFTPSPVHSTPS